MFLRMIKAWTLSGSILIMSVHNLGEKDKWIHKVKLNAVKNLPISLGQSKGGKHGIQLRKSN